MNYGNKTELELRKQAIKFDGEIIYWMRGFRFWLFLMVIIAILGIFVWWFNIGAVAIGIWMMFLINRALKAKMDNHDENIDKVEGLENAK